MSPMTHPWMVAAPALSMLMLVGAAGCGSSGSTSSDRAQTSTTVGSSTPADASSTTVLPPTGVVIEITVASGRVSGGVRRVKADLGQSVTVRITSDIAEELHVHGYDLKRDLMPGTPVVLTFTADIPGVFDLELEHAGLKVAELQVA